MRHNKKIKIAVFPIAGMGTRFLPITKTISKEMLNILDRPLLDYAVQEAKAAGIETFIFVTNKENTKPVDYFSKNTKLESFLKKKKKIDLKKGNKQLVITKSTVPVGTGKKIQDIICGLRPELINNKDYFVSSNPEFLREGSAIEDFMRPDRVVCGVTDKKAEEILKELYRPLNLREAPVLFTDLESAEIIKYASNAFLALKVSFINEIANLCEKTGGNVQMVAKGMGLDNRIGPKFLHPGPGFGGSCFPKDTRALYASFKKNKIKNTLVKSVINFNEDRKISIVNKIKNILKPL